MAFVDANAASASVVNVTALRKLDVPCEFCKPLLSRLRLAQLFKLCLSALSGPLLFFPRCFALIAKTPKDISTADKFRLDEPRRCDSRSRKHRKMIALVESSSR